MASSNRKTISCVAYGHGRVGSSATMGLLRLSGFNVGAKERLTGAFPANPKGFFELWSQNVFLEVSYPETYPAPQPPPKLEEIESKGERHAAAYRKLLSREFGDDFPIAIKSQRMLTLPFLHELQDEIETRVLVLDRNIEDQAKSIRRVWEKADVRGEWTLEDIKSLLVSWKGFRDRVCEHYDFPIMPVQFQDVIHQPCETTRDITDFLDVRCPSENDIRAWIDPKLANREKLEGIGLNDNLLKRASRKLGRLLSSYGEPHW